MYLIWIVQYVSDMDSTAQDVWCCSRMRIVSFHLSRPSYLGQGVGMGTCSGLWVSWGGGETVVVWSGCRCFRLEREETSRGDGGEGEDAGEGCW
jgi:hypothetical protein